MREIRNIALLFILTIPNLFCAEQVSRLIIHAAVGFAGVGIGMFGGDFYGIVVLLCPVEGYGYGLFRLVINGRDINGIRGIVLEAEILASLNNCCI